MTTKTTTPLVTGLLTVEQCADILGCSVSMVERLIGSGDLKRVSLTTREVGDGPRKRGPKNWRVKPETLLKFINDHEGAERPKGQAAVSVEQAPVVVPMGTGTDGRSRARLPKRGR